MNTKMSLEQYKNRNTQHTPAAKIRKLTNQRHHINVYKIKITQKTFDQIAIYNMSLKAELLMVTNGINHYYCKIDYKNQCYKFINDIYNK